MFPGTLIMYGAHERYLLEQASHWLGETTRRTESYDAGGGGRSSRRNSGRPSAGKSFSLRAGRKRNCYKKARPESGYSSPTGLNF